MRVLSLFDGMSCGQIALNKIGITNYEYYASEIEKSSITVTQRNYPSTVQLGNILELDESKLKRLNKIDLLYSSKAYFTDISTHLHFYP
ncbi:DNA cytosine methyltransferase [Bacillus subtilis]|nr:MULTISPECIES: DNA cytosine methyltransferase [Bacillus]MBE1868656.1 DNA cytosine methyltransferase [Bacillus subtilis]NMJ92956.1 hypothetical protein [Bacillus sp. WR12]NUC10212.1 DNA cytosine methyltransferase [Bacillus subtilis]QAT75025.1 hypothetical protein D9C22_10900 [Bacillus sp. WR11]